MAGRGAARGPALTAVAVPRAGRPEGEGGGGDGVVAIESLAAGGDGLGHLGDGMAVFVPRTAPGDRVRLERVRRRRRHAHALVGALVAGSPDRIEPRCPHFVNDACGGCQWQHLPVEAQRRAKRRIVGDALRRLGHLPVEDPALVPSPRDFGYRATITPTVRWATRGEGPVAGFHRHDSGEVFPLEHCDIAREEVNALWAAIRPALGSLPRGDDVRLKLRVAPDGALHLLVSGGDGAWADARPLLEAAARAGLAPASWRQGPGERGAPRLLAGGEGAPAGPGGRDRSAVAFEQVNPEVATALREAVVASVPATARRVLDLYAGTGEVGLALAPAEGDASREVACVEVNAAAARRALEEARRLGVRLAVHAERVEAAIGRLLPADVVIVNPPRTGLGPGVAAALAARMPPRLVYVSCDPATLARDLARLGATADALSVRCFDMFPQTSHVETLAVLARSPDGAHHGEGGGS